MTRTAGISRFASITAAGAALALGASVVATGPAQAEVHAAGHTEAASAQSQEQQAAFPTGSLRLVRSATEPTVYYLKVPASGGVGDAPAPDGKYDVTLTSGDRHEHFVVQATKGRLDLKDSTILKTATFDPYISVTWIGER